MRHDLLALTPDDLVLLANRGLAKRAQQEIQSSDLNYELNEDPQGQVVELVRGIKPIAHLHTLNCAVRFLVRADLHYTHCDCAEASPRRHVPLAVWAFRRLDSARSSGIVDTAQRPAEVPLVLLESIEGALRALVSQGMDAAPQALIERLRRLESRCRAEQLIWPAEVIAEILHQHAAYVAHDARFTPTRIAALFGELCVRCDAIRNNTGAVPQLFVRGTSSDSETAIGTARLIGLGCRIRVRQGGVELAAYMQDVDTGTVVVAYRDEPDPDEDSRTQPAPFWQLSQAAFAQGVGLAAFGAGQALVKGGRRMPNAQFVLGRAKLTVNPQAFVWESLRAPVLVEDFAELVAHIVAQPPASLRPRRLTDGLYVCPVVGAENASFLPAEQAVQAILRDAEGNHATLLHPYTSRGQAGVEALLGALRSQLDQLRFVAGHVQPAGGSSARRRRS